MKQDKWTQQLRDKLADYETAAPDELWANIESALEQLTPPAAQPEQQKPRFIALRRWAVAASLTALLFGSGYWWWPQEKTAPQEKVVSQKSAERQTTAASQGEEPATAPKLVAAIDDRSSTHQAQHQMPETAEADNLEKEAPKQNDTKQADEQDEQEKQDKQEKHEPQEERNKKKTNFDFSNPAPPTNTVRQHQSVALRLYASNGFGTQGKTNGVLMSQSMASLYGHAENLANTPSMSRTRRDAILLANYKEEQKHYQPVSFGLSVGYPLTTRLSVSTGVVYTRLRSDFTNTTPSQILASQQRLTYLGVPLSLDYIVWQNRSLKAYAAVGAQVDWNIKAEVENNGQKQTIGKDRSQWSFNTSLGLQYNILPTIGLYAEPGLKYYPDNGSKIQNFFKDKPTNFNLQLGLRLNL